jgi:hypothetical protein
MKFSGKILNGFLLIILGCTTSFAQQYQTVYSTTQSFYQYQPGRFVTGIKPDSLRLSGLDTILYHYRIAALDPRIHPTGACSSLSFFFPSFQGLETIVKPNGDNLFFNLGNDTLLIQTRAGIGQTWVLYTFPSGNRIQASVSTIQQETLNTFSDSVKTITLQAVNTSGTPITHPMNGIVLQLSKTRGWFRTLNWTNFPNDTTSYAIDPARLLSNMDIYSYNVHDQFIVGNMQGGGPPLYFQYEILSKNLYGTDSVYYQVRRVMQHLPLYSPPPYSYTYTTDTITWKYYNLSLPVFPGMPDNSQAQHWGYEMIAPSDTSCGKHYTLQTREQASFYSNDSCHSNIYEPQPAYFTYIQEEGSYSYIDESIICGCGTYISSTQLSAYYNALAGPACSLPLNLSVQEKTNAGCLHLFPNPAHDVVMLEKTGPAFSCDDKLELTDVSGRKQSRFTYSLQEKQAMVNTAELAPGLYFIILHTPGGCYSSRFVEE